MYLIIRNGKTEVFSTNDNAYINDTTLRIRQLRKGSIADDETKCCCQIETIDILRNSKVYQQTKHHDVKIRGCQKQATMQKAKFHCSK